MSNSHQRVVVLGASNKSDKYSYKAYKLLREHGHEAIPVNRGLDDIEGEPVTKDLSAIAGPIDTLTMYVNKDVSSLLTDKIIQLKPGRVIFNPGSENPALQQKLSEATIPWEAACTLVLLKSGQF